jgi:ubiquinone/menaquinone biosynthesis C-methylase UbiE
MIELMKRLRGTRVVRRPGDQRASERPTSQDLDIYWDEKMADALESWGKDTTWVEIQFLAAPLQGSFLDIACGTGTVMLSLSRDLGKEVYGCDISGLLLKRASEKGLPAERLFEEDATRMSFQDKRFDYSYSIGSLEHFTEEGIDRMLCEAARVTRHCSFHMIPVARSGRDEGWLKTVQSAFNNSVDWWRPRFERHFREIRVLDSRWQDSISVGKWIVCRH